MMMAYDPSTESILLFGGDDGQTVLDDMWRWNGFDWESLRVNPHVPRPGGAT